MASTDATALPIKNQAYRITFPLFDADGDLVTGATGLDSEVSIDAGTFADCTNEATEIATASGIYYLDLTSGEMNGDTIAIIIKTTSSGAKTTPIILYPQEAGDLKVNVTYWNGTAVATPATAGIPDVNVKNIDNDAASASGTVTFPNATLASTTNITAGVITTVSGNVTGSVGSIATGGIAAASFAAGAIDAAAIATDAIGSAELAASAITEIQAGLSTLDAAGVRAAVGLASANLDTQLTTIDDFLDTEVAAIKAKTDNLPSDPADASDIAGAFSTVNSTLSTIAGYIDTEIANIQSRLPAALVSGRMDSSVGAMATDVITSGAVAASAVTELQTGLSTLDAAGIRTAVGLATANLDTQLTTIDDFLDTEVAAIKAKTDGLPSDPADASDIAASFSTVNATLATIAGYVDTEVASVLAAVDTEVAAIKAKTDNLPASPANEATLTTIAGYIDTEVAAILAAVDTEVAAIKLQTDLIPASPAAVGSAMTLTSGERNSISDALLDRADAIETGLTFRQAARLWAAALAGKASGLATTTAVYRNAVADSKARITATVDVDGNRTAITTDVT